MHALMMNERSPDFSSATISAYLCVTEPALFGLSMSSHLTHLVAGMIGSSIAGLLSVTFDITAQSIGLVVY